MLSFSIDQQGKYALQPSVFRIADHSVYLSIHQQTLQPFIDANLPVFVNCSRAPFVEAVCGDPLVYTMVDPEENGLFAVMPCEGTDLVVSPFCLGLEAAFCQLNLTLPNRAVIEYGKASGI
jgi:hypothetical protein